MGSAERAIGLTKYFVSLPRARTIGAYLILVGALFGLIVSISTQKIAEIEIIGSVGMGVFLISLPAFLSAFTVYLVCRWIPLKRVLVLSLFGAMSYGVFYVIGILLLESGVSFGGEVILVGFGLIFVIWFLIAKLVFGLGKISFVFATLQLFYNAIFLMTTHLISFDEGWMPIILKMYFSSLLFLIALYSLFFVLNAPMKRNIGVDSTQAISMFAAQWLEGGKELEETFESMGEEVETLLGTIVFKGSKKETVFLVPGVHFGPFGNLGGSEFSKLLANRLEGENRDVFVFHSLVTNDMNPVSSREIEKIIACFEGQYKKMEFSPAVGNICRGRGGNSHALCLKINDFAFVGFSRAPLTTEDVNFGIGRSLQMLANRFVREAVLVDQHNSETGDITSVEPGSHIQFEMEEALLDALEKNKRMERLELGCGAQKLECKSVGGGGIKTALFGFGKKFFALILLDSNGVVPSFRDEVIREVKEWGKKKKMEVEAEIFTTDTHEVNIVQGVLNPVGKRREEGEEVISAIVNCLEEAKRNMEGVSAGVSVDRFTTTVLGAKVSTEVVATISAVIAIARIAIPVILIGTVILILWSLTKIK
ncbi:MAG: DUF2070 family protein [Candidatus Anstonellales archaeon]